MKLKKFNQFIKENINMEDDVDNNMEHIAPGREDDGFDGDREPMAQNEYDLEDDGYENEFNDDEIGGEEDVEDEFGEDYMDEPTEDFDEEEYLYSDENNEGEEETEEEEGMYKGETEMKELADMLNTKVVNNQIEYNGKKINFFSETEKFHVDRKKFNTKEEVIEYLEGGAPAMESPNSEMPERDMEDMPEMDMEDKGMDIPGEREMAMESRRFIRRRFK